MPASARVPPCSDPAPARRNRRTPQLLSRALRPVGRRPVAELLPLPSRPRSVPWSAFIRDSDRWQADLELARELAELLPDTTDNLSIP